MKELHRDLDDLGSLEELTDRLGEPPYDLPPLFTSVLCSTDLVHKRYMARLLLLLSLREITIDISVAHYIYKDSKDSNIAVNSKP